MGKSVFYELKAGDTVRMLSDSFDEVVRNLEVLCDEKDALAEEGVKTLSVVQVTRNEVRSTVIHKNV